MKIVLANPRGFCAGVEMAIQTVERALSLFGRPVYVYHEIVHNIHVIRQLEDKGAIFVDDVDDVPVGQTLIFSAHGVAPQVRRQAESRKLATIDATCPLVAKVHAEARSFERRGYHIILIGHADHDEILGTFGEAPASIRVVANIDEASQINLPPDAKAAYLTQTTLSVDDAENVIAYLRKRFPRIVGPAKSDICYATQNRQNAVRQLASAADVVLVLGSRNSSNSNRLWELAESCGTRAYLLDDHAELDRNWFTGNETVLITAGASAPETAVKNVVDRLVQLFHADVIEEPGVQERAPFALPREVRQEPLLGGQGAVTSCGT